MALFPALVTFAWMFEFTPVGLRFTRQVSIKESITSRTGRKIDFVIIGLLSLALTFFAYQYFQIPDPLPTETDRIAGNTSLIQTRVAPSVVDEDTRPSVAVLAFVNMSSDKENEYFSDGLSEELLNVLAKTKGLRVAGRTSSFFYKGKNKNLTEIGKELNVDNILEGSVRKSGNQVRITAQLVSAGDGFHLWSDTFDREIDDIFAVQDEISSQVVMAMKIALLTDGVMVADRRTNNSEAYDVYLRAKNALYSRQFDAVLHAMDLYQLSSSLDPEYATPRIEHAAARLIAYNNNNYGTLDEASSIAKAELDKAKSLGFETSDYYATLGLYHNHMGYVYPGHFVKAEAAYLKAIAVNENNVNAYIWYSTLLRESGDHNNDEKEIQLLETALRLDPLNRVANENYGVSLSQHGRLEEAESHLKRLAHLDPEYHTYQGNVGIHYLTSVRLEEAIEIAVKLPSTDRQKAYIASTTLFNYNDIDAVLDLINQVPVESEAYEYMQLLETTWNAPRVELIAEAKVHLLQTDEEAYGLILINRLMQYGEYDVIRRLVENALPKMALVDPDVAGARYLDGSRTAYLTAIYKLGQTERSKLLAKKILAFNAGVPHMGIGGKGAADVLCYQVLGQSEKAIQEFLAVTRAGWLGYYGDGYKDHPLMDELRDEPRILGAIKKIEDELNRQKEAVYEKLNRHNLISSSI